MQEYELKNHLFIRARIFDWILMARFCRIAYLKFFKFLPMCSNRKIILRKRNRKILLLDGNASKIIQE